MDANFDDTEIWSTVFRDAATGIILAALDGRIVQVNPAMAALLGYGEDELRSMTLAAIGHPDDAEADRQALRQLRAGAAGQHRMERRYRRKDGRTVRGLLTMSLARGAAGEPRFVIGMVESVDRHRRAGQAAQRAERRLIEILDALPAYVSEIDREDRYRFVNQAYEAAFGRGRAEIEGRRVDEILGEEAYRQLRGRLAAARGGTPVTYVDELALGDLGVRHVRVSYVPHGDAEGVFVFAVDETERVAAERAREGALRELEAKTRTLDAVLSAAAESISMFDRDGRYLYASRRAARELGLEPAQLTGRRVGELEMPSEAAAEIDRRIETVVATGRPVAAEMEMPRPEGSRFYEYIMTPVTDDAGQVVTVVSVSHDITERRMVEASMRRSLAEKEVLLREVHHRVKNNMQVIVSLLNLQSQDLTDPQLRRSHDELGNRIRALALVHQMLTEGPTLERIDLADYVARLCSQLRRLLLADHADRVACRMTVTEPVMVDMDRAVPLGLIVNELVSNSLIHGFPGERRGTVTIALAMGQDGATLSIADDGVGYAGPDRRRPLRLGTRLIDALTAQIGGTLGYERLEPGCRATLRWPPAAS